MATIQAAVVGPQTDFDFQWAEKAPASGCAKVRGHVGRQGKSRGGLKHAAAELESPPKRQGMLTPPLFSPQEARKAGAAAGRGIRSRGRLPMIDGARGHVRLAFTPMANELRVRTRAVIRSLAAFLFFLLPSSMPVLAQNKMRPEAKPDQRKSVTSGFLSVLRILRKSNPTKRNPGITPGLGGFAR